MQISLPFKISLIIHGILLVALLFLNPLKPIKTSGKIILSIQSRPRQNVENLEQRDTIESMDAPVEQLIEQQEANSEPIEELIEREDPLTEPVNIIEENREIENDFVEAVVIEADIKPTQQLEVEYSDSYRLDIFEEDLLSQETLLLDDLDSGSDTNNDTPLEQLNNYDISWSNKVDRKMIYIPDFTPPLESTIDLNIIQNVAISFSVSTKGYIVNSKVIEPGSGDILLDNWFLEQVSTVIFEKVDENKGKQSGVFTFFFDSGGS